MPINCNRCRRQFFSAAHPRPGQRCPVCRGPLRPLSTPAASGGRSTGRRRRRPPRCPSPERDLGLRWRDADERVYRAAWAAETRELILVQLGPEDSGGGHVDVLAVADERLVWAPPPEPRHLLGSSQLGPRC